jgi:hypothetical protein
MQAEKRTHLSAAPPVFEHKESGNVVEEIKVVHVGREYYENHYILFP